jgi:hypothetical protein
MIIEKKKIVLSFANAKTQGDITVLIVQLGLKYVVHYFTQPKPA